MWGKSPRVKGGTFGLRVGRPGCKKQKENETKRAIRKKEAGGKGEGEGQGRARQGEGGRGGGGGQGFSVDDHRAGFEYPSSPGLTPGHVAFNSMVLMNVALARLVFGFTAALQP